METIQLPHLPDHPLHVVLFQDVQNAPFLRQQLLDGNTDFQYAFLDASVLLSRSHVLSACWRAINDQLADRMKSHNVHSEIVFAMSPNNNVRCTPLSRLTSLKLIFTLRSESPSVVLVYRMRARTLLLSRSPATGPPLRSISWETCKVHLPRSQTRLFPPCTILPGFERYTELMHPRKAKQCSSERKLKLS